MALTDTAARQAKAKDKQYKLADEKGMFLLVKPKGQKYWRLKYRFAGKEKLLAIGVYPEISLKEARTLRDRAREQLRKGIDPNEAKKAEKASKNEAAANSFETVAQEWFESPLIS
jgi:ribosomal protein L7/L12